MSAALGLHAPTTLVIVLAHVGDVDDFRDDVATFAGITPEVFPAWEKLPRELDASDEVFGRRLRVLKQPGRRDASPSGRDAPSRRRSSRCPSPRRWRGCRGAIGVGDSRARRGTDGVAAGAGDGAGRSRRGPRRVQRPRRHPRRLSDRRHRPGPHRVLRRRGRVDPPVRRRNPSARSTAGTRSRSRLPLGFDEPIRASFGHPADYFPEGTWVALLEPDRPARRGPALPRPARRPARALHGRDAASSG